MTMLLSILLTMLGQTDAPPGESVPEHPANPATATLAPPMDGLWPSQRLTKLMLSRWVDRMSNKYELDDTQRAQATDATLKRWLEFSREHRAKIQPLVNEFMEMRLGMSPPETDTVQKWAQRAGPVFDAVQAEFESGKEDYRRILRPLQRAKFEIDVMKYTLGLNVARQKLAEWENGEVDEHDVWQPTPSARARRREEQSQADAERIAQPTDQIVGEVNRWRKFVEEFCRDYKLDEGQRDAAASCLVELSERALAHRDSRKQQIDDFESRIEKHSVNLEEADDLRKRLEEHYGPIDAMFMELKTRLKQIPTEAQRADREKTTAETLNEP